VPNANRFFNACLSKSGEIGLKNWLRPQRSGWRHL